MRKISYFKQIESRLFDEYSTKTIAVLMSSSLLPQRTEGQATKAPCSSLKGFTQTIS